MRTIIDRAGSTHIGIEDRPSNQFGAKNSNPFKRAYAISAELIRARLLQVVQDLS